MKFASKYKGTSSMDCRERGSHARCLYPTQYTSRMGTSRVMQEEEADTRIIVTRVESNLEGRNMGAIGRKNPKEG